jgi:hypothetical protein
VRCVKSEREACEVRQGGHVCSRLAMAPGEYGVDDFWWSWRDECVRGAEAPRADAQLVGGAGGMSACGEAPREDAQLVDGAGRRQKAGMVARRRAVARSTWGIGKSEQRRVG